MIGLYANVLFIASSFAALVERQNEKPTGFVDPSTVKDCTFWYNSLAGKCSNEIFHL
jgi:hypothetical protein